MLEQVDKNREDFPSAKLLVFFKSTGEIIESLAQACRSIKTETSTPAIKENANS